MLCSMLCRGVLQTPSQKELLQTPPQKEPLQRPHKKNLCNALTKKLDTSSRS